MLRRHLSRIVMAHLAGLVSVSGALVHAPAVHHTASRTPYTKQTILEGSSLKLRSSTGKLLYVNIEADRFSQRPIKKFPSSTDLIVFLSDRQGESHSWDLEPPDSVFTYQPIAGTGSVTVKDAQIPPFGHMQLTFASAGASKVHTCGDGATITTRHVRLSGTFLFKTHSSAWGRVGSATKPLRFTGKSTVEVDQGRLTDKCEFGGAFDQCAGGIGMNSPGSGRGLFIASTNRRSDKHPFILFTTEKSVGKNYDADFETDAIRFKGSLTLHTRPDGTVVEEIHAGSTGIITGSATLVSSGPPKTYDEGCKAGPSKSWQASYTNGKNPLTVHLEIGGTFSSRNRAAGNDGANITQDAG